MRYPRSTSRHGKPRSGPAARRALSTSITALLCAGCLSANPQGDIDRTIRLASPRTGIDASLAELWSVPWQDQTGGWDGSSPLGVNDAVRGALQNDPALRRHLAMIAERRAALSQASLPPNPVIALAVGTAVDGVTGAPFFVQLLQQLTWLWTMGDRIDVAEAVLDAAVFNAAHRVVTTSARARITFARAMCMERLTSLNKAYVETTQRSLNKVAGFQRAGTASAVDVQRARMDADRAKADYASALHVYRALQLELLRLMGRPAASTDWQMAGNLAQTLTYDPPAEAEIETRATQVRLDIAAAERFRSAADAGTRLAGWARFPKVSLATGFRQNFVRRHAWMTGGAVSLPIFDPGSAQIAGATARSEQADLSVAVLQQEAITEARMALNEWQRARQQTHLYRTGLVGPAKKVVEELLTEDDPSEAYITELLLAQRRAITLERTMVQQMLDGATAWVKLETAVGGSLALPLPKAAHDAP